MGREPLDHRLRIEEGLVDTRGGGAHDSVPLDRVGAHGWSHLYAGAWRKPTPRVVVARTRRQRATVSPGAAARRPRASALDSVLYKSNPTESSSPAVSARAPTAPESTSIPCAKTLAKQRLGLFGMNQEIT